MSVCKIGGLLKKPGWSDIEGRVFGGKTKGFWRNQGSILKVYPGSWIGEKFIRALVVKAWKSKPRSSFQGWPKGKKLEFKVRIFGASKFGAKLLILECKQWVSAVIRVICSFVCNFGDFQIGFRADE